MQISIKFNQCITYRYILKITKKKTFLGSCLWNLLQNFLWFRHIIRGRSIYLMVIFYVGLLIRLVYLYLYGCHANVNSTSWDAALCSALRFNEQKLSIIFHTYSLDQRFPKWVPRNPRVPRYLARGSSHFHKN